MAKVAIVYHSGFGHTEVLANHVVSGARNVEGVTADLFDVETVTGNADQLNEYDAIVFGAPTYMGSASAPMKAFMDTTQKIWMDRHWQDKIAAGFTNSAGLSGDKFNTLVQFVTFASQHGMIWVSLGMHNESSFAEGVQSGDPATINRVGAYIGAMAQSDNAPAEITPPAGDKKTALLLGERVAQAALRWG